MQEEIKEKVVKEVTDLGAGAYLLMHGFRALGKRGRSYIFETDIKAAKEFDNLILDYLNSDFHRFDACLMSLKKMHDYTA